MTVLVDLSDDGDISLFFDGDDHTHIHHMSEREAWRLAIDLEHVLRDD